jgi:large subunit ribosomal protein L10
VNRDQKAAAIAEIATQIQESEAVYAVDYRGISVTQAAELRTKLRDADASFRIVKNTLTERAADEAGAEGLKALLTGPTALTFVRGDAAVAAKAVRDYARTTPDLLAFKGGMLGKDSVDAEQIRSIAALPSRDVLIAQLVGVTASPITGLVRSLGALVGGLAVALGGVLEKKESGEIPSGDAPAPAPAAEAVAEEPAAEEAPAAAEEPAAEEAPAAEATTETETQED